jgi:hypothetical protein
VSLASGPQEARPFDFAQGRPGQIMRGEDTAAAAQTRLLPGGVPTRQQILSREALFFNWSGRYQPFYRREYAAGKFAGFFNMAVMRHRHIKEQHPDRYARIFLAEFVRYQ